MEKLLSPISFPFTLLVVSPGLRQRQAAGLRLAGDNPRTEAQQFGEVAAVDWKLFTSRSVRRVLRVVFSVCRTLAYSLDRDGLGNGTDLEREVERESLREMERDLFCGRREALLQNRQR